MAKAAWDNTENYPGIQCFPDCSDCAPTCDQNKGFRGLCYRPMFFGLTSPEDQPTEWNILESTLGAPLKFDDPLILIRAWYGGFWPLSPGLRYSAAFLGGDDEDKVNHQLVFRKLCEPGDPLPSSASWFGNVVTEGAKPQDPVTWTEDDMTAQTDCTIGNWPVPPFTITPRKCCGGVVDIG
ncbi:unnamed protein product [marine sediment metagenome]|uniref:Uncharacterized protein n=1 Tax=marine sediment metagenome TaxID=412755 RepID=X0ZVB1_9ZZZZ